MPNREELAKEELEILLTDIFRMYLNLIKSRDDYSVEMVLPELLSEVADRVIEAGWKSPLECNKCIDEGALRTSNAIDKAVETIFDHLFSFELTDDGKGVYLGFSIQQLKDIGQYPVTILRKGEYRE